jgi:hypothetical protein
MAIRRGGKERSLEANLAGLRAYRKRDPGFQRAIAAFVAAEVSLEDPLEGEPVEGQIVEGKLKQGRRERRRRPPATGY